MENEIKVGEYIRANGGYIGKVIKIREKEGRECDTYYVCDTVMASGFYEHIIKHSPNLIDLIQCGDYVNGKEVTRNNLYRERQCILFGIDYVVKENNIGTIVTKEQFNAISYKVERKD